MFYPHVVVKPTTSLLSLCQFRAAMTHLFIVKYAKLFQWLTLRETDWPLHWFFMQWSISSFFWLVSSLNILALMSQSEKERKLTYTNLHLHSWSKVTAFLLIVFSPHFKHVDVAMLSVNSISGKSQNTSKHKCYGRLKRWIMSHLHSQNPPVSHLWS